MLVFRRPCGSDAHHARRSQHHHSRNQSPHEKEREGRGGGTKTCASSRRAGKRGYSSGDGRFYAFVFATSPTRRGCQCECDPSSPRGSRRGGGGGRVVLGVLALYKRGHTTRYTAHGPPLYASRVPHLYGSPSILWKASGGVHRAHESTLGGSGGGGKGKTSTTKRRRGKHCAHFFSAQRTGSGSDKQCGPRGPSATAGSFLIRFLFGYSSLRSLDTGCVWKGGVSISALPLFTVSSWVPPPRPLPQPHRNRRPASNRPRRRQLRKERDEPACRINADVMGIVFTLGLTLFPIGVTRRSLPPRYHDVWVTTRLFVLPTTEDFLGRHRPFCLAVEGNGGSDGKQRQRRKEVRGVATAHCGSPAGVGGGATNRMDGHDDNDNHHPRCHRHRAFEHHHGRKRRRRRTPVAHDTATEERRLALARAGPIGRTEKGGGPPPSSSRRRRPPKGKN